MNPKEQTQLAWKLFSRFTDTELNQLLDMAGLVVAPKRGGKLHQTLLVWFDGNVPSNVEVIKLANEEG